MASTSCDNFDYSLPIYFPRCEYRARFTGTSAFEMTEPEFWGTYFRSTSQGGNSDRLSKSISKKIYSNSIINKKGESSSKLGAFFSPWLNDDYKNIFSTNPVKIYSCKNDSDEFLYDSLLEYKNKIVKNIIVEFNNRICNESFNNSIAIHHCNDYPCLIVMIPGFNCIPGETSSLYSIACAYFVALCNQTTLEYGVPVEMVLRSSFGHNIPSVAETSKSFRINIGLVPHVYCQIVADSLIKLDVFFLKPLIDNSLRLNFQTSMIEKHNSEVNSYNECKTIRCRSKSVELWDLDEPLFTVLCKTGDSRGSKVSFQITRKNKYLDLLADFVSDELNTLDSEANLSKPLNKLLSFLVYEVTFNKRNTTISKSTINVPSHLYNNIKSDLFLSKEEHSYIASDSEFWGIVHRLDSVLNVHGVDDLREAVNTCRLHGLYYRLELFNLSFVRNSTYIKASDGPGSDSECEIIEWPRLFCKKLIVATGLRAINLCHFIALYRMRQLKCKPKIDISCMYYETSDAVRNVNDILSPILFYDEEMIGTATIRYIDLNHCSSSKPVLVTLEEEKKKLSSSDIIIFDYTSAKTDKIRYAIDLFIMKVPVIILLCSGLKNEQLGADMNPYGTVRIITQDLSLLRELYFVMLHSIGSEPVPKHVHCIRKAYKDIGAVVSNEVIFKGKCHYTPQQFIEHRASINSVLPLDKYITVMSLLNNERYRENFCLLLEADLHQVFTTFFHFGNLERLTESVKSLCNLSTELCLSAAINALSFEELKHLLRLLEYGLEKKLHRLLDEYGLDILDVVQWNRKFVECIGSDEVQELIECHKEEFDIHEIINCYQKDNDIVETMVRFWSECQFKDCLFWWEKFTGTFETLYNKKFKRGIYKCTFATHEDDMDEENHSNTSSEVYYQSDGSSYCSLDEDFSCDEELANIYWDNYESFNIDGQWYDNVSD